MTPGRQGQLGGVPDEEVPPEVAEGPEPSAGGGHHDVAPSTSTAGTGSLVRMRAVMAK